MEYKKSYKGFVIWMIGFVVISFSVCFLPFDESIMTRVTLNVCTISIAILAYIIYKTEYVYWYNGTPFEEALLAGSLRRKVFAMRHLKRFGLFAMVYLILSVILHVLNIGIWADIVVVTIGLIAVAISTIPIKL